MNKRGLSNIIAVVLVVVLALGVVSVVWFYVSDSLRESAKQVEYETKFIGVDFILVEDSLVIDNGDVDFIMKRRVGGGDIDGFVVVLEDENGRKVTIDKYKDAIFGVLDNFKVEIFKGEHNLENIAKIGIHPTIVDEEDVIVSSSSALSFPVGGYSGGGGSGGNGGGGGTTYPSLENLKVKLDRTTEKYWKNRKFVSQQIQNNFDIDMALNEYEGFQLVLMSDEELGTLSVSFQGLEDFDIKTYEEHFVFMNDFSSLGYIQDGGNENNQHKPQYPTLCNYLNSSEGDCARDEMGFLDKPSPYNSLEGIYIPDPLVERSLSGINLINGENKVFYIELKPKDGVGAGTRNAKVIISNGGNSKNYDINVDVWDITLGNKVHAIAENDANVLRKYHNTKTSEEFKQVYDLHSEFLAEHRVFLQEPQYSSNYVILSQWFKSSPPGSIYTIMIEDETRPGSSGTHSYSLEHGNTPTSGSYTSDWRTGKLSLFESGINYRFRGWYKVSDNTQTSTNNNYVSISINDESGATIDFPRNEHKNFPSNTWVEFSEDFTLTQGDIDRNLDKVLIRFRRGDNEKVWFDDVELIDVDSNEVLLDLGEIYKFNELTNEVRDYMDLYGEHIFEIPTPFSNSCIKPFLVSDSQITTNMPDKCLQGLKDALVDKDLLGLHFIQMDDEPTAQNNNDILGIIEEVQFIDSKINGMRYGTNFNNNNFVWNDIDDYLDVFSIYGVKMNDGWNDAMLLNDDANKIVNLATCCGEYSPMNLVPVNHRVVGWMLGKYNFNAYYQWQMQSWNSCDINNIENNPWRNAIFGNQYSYTYPPYECRDDVVLTSCEQRWWSGVGDVPILEFDNFGICEETRISAPEATLRLKLLRDGLEDGEYINLLEELIVQADGQGIDKTLQTNANLALSSAESLIVSTIEFNLDGSEYDMIRKDMAQEIVNLQNALS